MKIQFDTVKEKRTDGYVKNIPVAYINITNMMKNYFDHVKKAIWIVDKYYGFYDYEEWKQSKKEANYKINGKTIMLEADSEVYIQFVSGKTVSFSTNELAWIANEVEMPL